MGRTRISLNCKYCQALLLGLHATPHHPCSLNNHNLCCITLCDSMQAAAAHAVPAANTAAGWPALPVHPLALCAVGARNVSGPTAGHAAVLDTQPS